MLNLMMCQSELQKLLSNDLGLNFDYKMHWNPNYLEATNSLSIKKYDDDVFTSISIYEKGKVFITFTFDKLYISETPLTLINRFNENNLYLSAYIDSENEWLVLRYSVSGVETITKAVSCVDHALGELLSDDQVEWLQPLTELTTG